MYITVRDVESGYDISGEVHYSLVGKHALFRVTRFGIAISYSFCTFLFELEYIFLLSKKDILRITF